MKSLIYTALLLLFYLSPCQAQDLAWLAKIRQIEPLKSTEKDVEKIFGKPTETVNNWVQYQLEEGKVTIEYSKGKCAVNEDSQYDVEQEVVTEVYFYTPKDIKFKSLNLNLVGFKKEYSSDADGAFSYENKALGISYSLSKEWLVSITITPAENYAYLACPKKPKVPEPMTDDVDQSTFVKLTQLKVVQNSRTDVAALFGAPFKSREDEFDFYMGEGYAFGFIYSTGKCTLLKEDIWNVPKGKIIDIVIIFNNEGIASTLNINKLSKKKDENGFSFYEDFEDGVEYKIKNDRIWRIEFKPGRKYNGLKCSN